MDHIYMRRGINIYPDAALQLLKRTAAQIKHINHNSLYFSYESRRIGGVEVYTKNGGLSSEKHFKKQLLEMRKFILCCRVSRLLSSILSGEKGFV
jgi:hypothetical protein